MTFEQAPDWCPVCRKNGCDCVYCHGARYVRTPSSPDLLRCDACNPAPEPAAPRPPAPSPPAPSPINSRRGRGYADRLDS